VAAALTGAPDGAESPSVWRRASTTPVRRTRIRIGRALYNGTLKNGTFQITHASPAITSARLGRP